MNKISIGWFNFVQAFPIRKSLVVIWHKTICSRKNLKSAKNSDTSRYAETLFRNYSLTFFSGTASTKNNIFVVLFMTGKLPFLVLRQKSINSIDPEKCLQPLVVWKIKYKLLFITVLISTNVSFGSPKHLV